jgi:tRNA (cmo5U34)-methyltransferase
MTDFPEERLRQREPMIAFDRERASSYDKMSAKLAPIRDSLHFLIRTVLSDLPANARILCVGAGTGAELLYLAQAFPNWQFTAVDPAIPMLDICRQRAEESGIASRCTFHAGYLDSLPESDSFDAANALLVSHFIMQPEERRNFFHQIALRLQPQGYLISSDDAYDLSSPTYPSILKVWLEMMKPAGIPDDEFERMRDTMRDAYGRVVAVLPPSEVASIITAGGFDAPVLFFQNLLIHAWYARRNTIL